MWERDSEDTGLGESERERVRIQGWEREIERDRFGGE